MQVCIVCVCTVYECGGGLYVVCVSEGDDIGSSCPLRRERNRKQNEGEISFKQMTDYLKQDQSV